jgi:peptidoglycan hydrolase-like protein with peptidoglycan-binding domain
MDIALFFKLFGLVQGIYSTYKSNADVASKVKDIAGQLWPVLAPFVKQWFPGVSDALAPAVVGVLADHELVTEIQTALNEHGANLTIDGWYGEATREAVKAFQQANDLEADGWAGKDTQKALRIA